MWRSDSMKILIIFLLNLLVVNAFGCGPGDFVSHLNPDGSVGGLKSVTSRVASSAYVAKTAKICDFVVVESNAKILDFAIIRDNAWIREFSIVKDYSQVSNNAITWGNERFPTIIMGKSKVYENAKVLAGSKILDNSEIYGSATLYSVIAKDNSKICQNFIIRNRQSNDDYFCNDTIENSSSVVSLENYRSDSFNIKHEKLKFVIEGAHFSLDENVFQVSINGKMIDPQFLEIL